MYEPSPLIFELINTQNQIDINDKIIHSPTHNLPLTNLGYIYFLKRGRHDFKQIIDKSQSSNEFYYVVNPFETNNVPNNLLSSLKIKSNDIENISNNFYKLWEMLVLLNIAKINNLTYVSIYDDSNDFMRAVMNYRSKFNNSKNKYFSINNELHKRTSFQGVVHYSVKSITDFNSDHSINPAYLVTANGSKNLSIDDDLEEVKSYELILGEIIMALKIQDKNGHFVLKIFDSFTILTIKLLYIVSSFYKKTFVYKPFYSRSVNTEKFVIFSDFKYDTKDKTLKKHLDTMIKCYKKIDKNKYIFDMFPDLQLPNNYIKEMKFINSKISNLQQIMISDINVYVNEEVYFGDKYHNYKKNQNEASKWWNETFFVKNNDKLFDPVITRHKAEMNKLSNLLLTYD